jgi:hypothetical protein
MHTHAVEGTESLAASQLTPPAAPLRYADFSKKTSDLLSNDYCFDRKFKLTTKTANGMTLTSEGTLLPKKIDAKLTAKFSPAAGVMVDKACVTSAGRLIGEVTVKNTFKGVDALVRVQDGAEKKGQGELEFRVAREKVALDTVIDVVDPTISAAVSYAINDNVLVGAYAKFDTKYDDDKSSAQFTEYDVAVAYAHKDINAVLGTKNKLSEVQLSVYHDVSPVAQTAMSCTMATTKGEVKELALGGMYALDAVSKVQGKVDAKGLVWANYIQIISPGVKGIASVQVDALNFAGDSHKFGLSLVLG